MLLAWLDGCAHVPSQALDVYLDEYWGSRPEPSRFVFCSSHGCSVRREIGLSGQEWTEIRNTFAPLPTSAPQERALIARAIGRFETMVGAKTGTDKDIGGSSPGMFMQDQLDCVDEMLNTGAYLTMLKNAGLISFHDLLEPAQRGNFFNGWPHVAIAIVDRETGRMYVVDSWYYDNGVPPVIIPYDEWMKGRLPVTSP